ncbi:MAG: tetraacyldisaccharide 4'-kinase [Helicobacter sp.]|nr:tetraacyldisaccharide 4'-kinase [Helicobacter sp.]MDY5741232.1 tetraacyldisaccharide 4'-kinase [Helicobacter sp.]
MRFIDSYFYNPSFWQKLLSILLLPLSVLYALSATLRRKLSPHHIFSIPIISVGNLILGGTGKTPFIIEVASRYQKAFIISRGYKRKSKGLVVVSLHGEILCSQQEAGDEAYLIATSLPNASVIVSKNRLEAVHKAISLGASCIFLDDGFRFNFQKLNLILKPKLEPYFPFTLPSGMYREMPYLYKSADLLIQEQQEYVREVFVENPTSAMLLLTAIANPARLDDFLPESIVGKILLRDHADFDKEFLAQEIRRTQATSLLVTPKDEVKLQGLGFKLSVLRLRLKIKDEVLERIDSYIAEHTQSNILHQEKQPTTSKHYLV